MTGHTDGLCSTCRHFSTCTYKKEVSPTVHFCEEYETGNSAAKAGRKRVFPADDPLKLIPGEKGRHKALGLCSDCVYRETCRFPRPESGVWHCEEYK